MKKFFCKALCLVFYFVGDLISKPLYAFDWAWLYPAYNKLMSWSVWWNDLGGLDEWKHQDE